MRGVGKRTSLADGASDSPVGLRLICMGTKQADAVSVDLSQEGRHATLTVHGEVDVTAAKRLQAEGTAWLERTDRLTVDLSEVTFMDSAGMKVLLDLSKQAKRDQLSLKPPTRLGGRRVVEVLGLPGLPWMD